MINTKRIVLSICLLGTTAFAQKGSNTIDLTYMDKNVKPQYDFYSFANGNWIKNNPVPASESTWGSFNELEKRNTKNLHTILEDLVKKKSLSHDEQLLVNFYKTFSNLKQREKVGLGFVKTELDNIDKIQNIDQLNEAIIDLQYKRVGAFYNFYASQDMKNVDKKAIFLSQGGLGLPNKNYYDVKKNKVLIEQYSEYIKQLFDLAGINYGNDKIGTIIYQFEKKLAENSKSPAELRIPENNYFPLDLNNINKYRNVKIEFLLKKFGFENVDKIVLGQPEYIEFVDKLIEKESLSTVKYYLKWRIINHYAPHLTEDFVNTNFDFYSKKMSGKSEMKPLHERAISQISSSTISQLLGKAFTEKHFSPEAKKRVNEMVDNILIAFEERINQLEWMSKETKVEALKKLHSIGRKLAYPDKWEDFSILELTSDAYIDNIRLMAEFNRNKMVSEFNDPIDKTKWSMAPHIINAYYHSLLNEIVFPAGIMQAPFFDVNAEDAVNYGRIGMVIGHEFTHGFDDMGSKFAADGNLKNWWTDEDRKLFEERTALLGNTFSHFCPIEGYCVNDKLTMGENIADLGGITLAYYAYEKTQEFKSNKKVNGYTPAQRFFIAYAQLWKINYTEAELKKRIETDPHSPGMYRVNGPLMNSPEFFKAFNVKEGDKMRLPKDKISKIW